VRRTLILVAAAVVVVLSAAPAAAHATLTGSNPPDGTTVPEPPAEITLEFSEPVQREFVQVAVLDADDGHHETGEPDVVGGTVTQAVATLPAGEYRISYRVGSSDGHPVSGTVTFTVAGQDDAEPSPTPEPSTTSQPDQTQSADQTEQPTATPQVATSETPVSASEESGSSLRWLGAAAAIAAAAALLFVLLRRPGSPEQPSESDTGPQ
jgi:methionine-rich copper-binding protein CopC